MKQKTFHGNGGPYLTVYTLLEFMLFGRQINLDVHHFHRGDEDPDCHDHPFHFVSLVLWGAYIEWTERGDPFLCQVRWPLSIGFKKATDRHRVTLWGKTCWTLIGKVDAKRPEEWGFWRDGQFVYWRDYLKQKGLEPIKKSY